ncbi:hypothetical protein PVK06_038988 [Gossypium arboreum]|uniref:non-specific serine/threonine protein kinase n=1 Tax=Gossypium arboreum TaxID=29729 RepID=A0ABR0N1N0_GOSAR|nr:hypothetical protein PVK06_038988 [Gossypium arboreum]
MIPSYMIELRKLLDRYPTSELNSFWLKNLFQVALEQLGDSLEEIRGSAFGGNMLWGGGPAYGCSIQLRKYFGYDYPFQGLDRPESCGYPGFKLICSEKELEITISSATYRVLAINKASQTFHVSRTDYSENRCPTHLINSTFESETRTFRQNGDSQDLRLYYGCQPLTAPQNLTSVLGISNRFDCTIKNTTIVGYYLTREFAGTVIGNFLRSCSNSVIIPVSNSQVPSLEEGRDPDDLEEAAKIGFQLGWSADDTRCNNCVNKGGQCGRNLVSVGFKSSDFGSQNPVPKPETWDFDAIKVDPFAKPKLKNSTFPISFSTRLSNKLHLPIHRWPTKLSA